MPIFLTIKNAAGTKSSMLTASLSGDQTFPGNLLATGITCFYAELPDGKRLRVDAWSVRATELDSYMVGEFDDGLFSMLGDVAAAQTAVATAEASAEFEQVEQPAEEVVAPPAAAPARRKRK